MAWLHTVIDVPARLHAPSASFWAGALGWPVGAAWAGHPELRSFEPVLGDAYVHLQQIDGAPRVHLDVESDDSRSTISAAVAAGAQPVTRSERWESLLSPGGLPFCVLKTRPRTAPDPVAWSDGHRSRLVQVCIDSPCEAARRRGRVLAGCAPRPVVELTVGGVRGEVAPRGGLRSQRSVTSRLLHDRIQVKAVGPVAGRGKRRQTLRGAFEESFRTNPIPAGRMRHGNTDLRKPLPQVTFLDRSGLPTRLQYLVG